MISAHISGGRTDHVGAFGQGDIFQLAIVLLHRDRFPGERGLVHREAPGFDDPGVGGDPPAPVQDDDVAGDHLLHGHISLPAAPDHGSARLGEHVERLYGLLGLQLVAHLHRYEGDDDREYGDGVLRLAQDGVKYADDQQEDYHRLGDLLERHPPPFYLVPLREDVMTMTAQSGRGLLLGQAVVRGAQGAHDRLCLESVPSLPTRQTAGCIRRLIHGRQRKVAGVTYCLALR
jgi:hypothetical protein